MLLGPEEFHQILSRFKTCTPIFVAFCDTNRQKLIMDIADAGKEGLNVTNLSAKTNLSRPAISHHLKILKDTGIIIPLKKGTQIFYKLNLEDNLRKIDELVNSMRSVIEKLEKQGMISISTNNTSTTAPE